MAVQAQYPSNILLLNRNVQESKNNILGTNDYSLEPQPGGGGFLEQSHMFFNNNGVGINPRKRSREIATTATHTTTTTVDSFNFSLQNHQQQNQNHQLIDLSQLPNHHHQQQHHHSVVSTGLKLSFGDQNHQQKQQQQQIQQHPALLSLFSDELAFQFKQQSDELNYFLHTQGEQLKRTLAEKRQRHYHALLGAAEEAVARQVREKEAELDTVTRRNAELQARAAQLSAESQAWQARAQAQEVQAMSLQAQIQRAMSGPGPSNVGGALQQDREGSGLNCAGDAEDAESVYNDPVSERRVNSPSCKACRTRVASVVLLPCRHMCVCVQCDDVVQACPVCFSLRSASVEVYLT